MNNNWLNPKVKPEKSTKHRNGEFAVEEIQKGEILAVFGGQVMTREYRDQLPEDVRYLALGIDDDLFIGPQDTKQIDDADWFNHSCNPNAGIKGQIMLVAMRDIVSGEEITFDYCMSCSELGEERILFECNCGHTACRNQISNKDWEINELQQEYDGYFSYFVERNIINS